ncbi:hypothetical protein KAFR_0J00570 [Kazachstania africana CBS 2517]|uniref:SUN domain-containing protein n=1 Tax=Kazachstania africana (strain ATCC 22294 / BCRC 22015 / CBS 2517 / CECT 1963 / NBRC 1671 / NRRL Y-8276) TaxID=1071382 RepID=H2B0H5_KAZAF|nr:hypothetical protein KAFR_0J00570 [Kazachstania africana CBS 2517]CCF60125.1 hypothetical protein KAFR_0J00570 [Kazachstania africana CBS 2517]
MDAGSAERSQNSIRDKYRDLLSQRLNESVKRTEDDDSDDESYEPNNSEGYEFESEDDEDYSMVEDPDKSFIQDNGDYEDTGLYSTEEDDAYYYDDDDEEEEEEEYRQPWFKSWGSWLLIFLFFSLLFKQWGWNTETGSLQSVGSMKSIQRQINHLYNELNSRDLKQKNELDNKLKIVISQFEKNIKKLLPSNVLNYQSEIDKLNKKVNSLSQQEVTLENVTEWQKELINQLKENLPNEIPVMVNNSSSVLVIPELHTYLSEIISNLVQNNVPPKMLEYDLNNYIREILTNEFQYVEKNYFINELEHKLQRNKLEIWNEIQNNLETWKNDQNSYKESSSPQYSTIFLKRLINEIYNVNQHQWDDDLDFATWSQGTKLIKHLTSPVYSKGNRLPSTELLSDSKYISSSTYWQCPNDKCSLALRFSKPLHLTKISYLHGRFKNNLHMMSSAPKLISMYIKLANQNGSKKLIHIAKKFDMGQVYRKDSTYIRVATYRYNLANDKIKQDFALPKWFIEFKPLIKSVLFQVEENHGNKDYVSLRKFIINGVLEEDLQILRNDQLELRFNRNTPEYSAQSEEDLLTHQQPKLITNSHIPSFGQDELDIA